MCYFLQTYELHHYLPHFPRFVITQNRFTSLISFSRWWDNFIRWILFESLGLCLATVAPPPDPPITPTTLFLHRSHCSRRQVFGMQRSLFFTSRKPLVLNVNTLCLCGQRARVDCVMRRGSTHTHTRTHT